MYVCVYVLAEELSLEYNPVQSFEIDLRNLFELL
jgi:hypothetical protein